ncbi:MAG: 16S rRNA processing protein RimM [Caldilineae bacterium]|nr:MAG: 16S rRNA processing protein RimM [Caldilineae bacterium]
MKPAIQSSPPPAQPSSGSDRKKAEPDFLVIGQIVKPHGVRGEVLVKVLTDFPERFETMQTVLVGKVGAGRRYTVESRRWHKGMVLLHLKGIADRNAAEILRGLYLQIPIAEAMPLEPGVYYHHQLLGLAVLTDDGTLLGELVDILETGANDVYIVQGPQGEILLPATEEVIRTIDLNAGQMIVHLLDGLL